MTKEVMRYQSWDTTYEVSFIKGQYRNNKSLAIQVMCSEEGEEFSEPFCMLTVNLAFAPDENCAYIDTNNCPMEIVKMLEEKGVITYTNVDQMSGFYIYPMYKFDEEWLNSLETIR